MLRKWEILILIGLKLTVTYARQVVGVFKSMMSLGLQEAPNSLSSRYAHDSEVSTWRTEALWIWWLFCRVRSAWFFLPLPFICNHVIYPKMTNNSAFSLFETTNSNSNLQMTSQRWWNFSFQTCQVPTANGPRIRRQTAVRLSNEKRSRRRVTWLEKRSRRCKRLY